MIDAIKEDEMEYQIAPPGSHYTLPAEQAIQTFKNHFTSILWDTEDNFMVNQWDWLIHQLVITLNIIWPSRMNPKLSAYNQLWRNFDFNKMPLPPQGCRAIIHNRSANHATWYKHGTIRYYITIAAHHYPNYKWYIPKTGGIRISDTVKFFPKHMQMPKTTLLTDLK